MGKPKYKDICKNCGQLIPNGDCDSWGCGGQGMQVSEAGLKKRKKLKKEEEENK